MTRSLSLRDESTGIVAYAKVRKEADRVRAAFTAALDVVVCAEVRPADDACAVAVGGVVAAALCLLCFRSGLGGRRAKHRTGSSEERTALTAVLEIPVV